MKKETLKQLIEMEFERTTDFQIIKNHIFKYIDLYEKELVEEKKEPSLLNIPSFSNEIPIPDTVLFCDICACNSKNGGSGLCSCTMPLELVPNPKKYGGTSVKTVSGTHFT